MSEQTCLQTKVAIIYGSYRLPDVCIRVKANQRCENLLTADAHVRLELGEYRWLPKISRSRSPYQHLGTAFARFAEPGLHAFARTAIDQRPDIGSFVKRITHLERFHALDELF